MNKVTDTASFKAKATLVHNGKYSYDLTEYTKSANNLTILCPMHGSFSQKANSHLSGRGCNTCGNAAIGDKARLSTQSFIEKATALHKGRYSYTDVVYEGAKIHVAITCKVHGTFLQSPSSHMTGAGCKYCGWLLTTASMTSEYEDTLIRCKKVHNNEYSYGTVDYKNSRSKLEIICSKHGVSYQTAAQHLGGSRCYKCSYENRSQASFYNKTITERNRCEYLKEVSGLYVLSMKGLGSDGVYKVGLSKDIIGRVKGLTQQIGSKPEILYYCTNNLYDTILKEQSLHRMLAPNLFNTPVKFSGYTECFSLPDETATDLIEYLNETFGEDTEIHE